MFGLGRDLQEDHVERMTDNQKLQLQKLHESAADIGEVLTSESKDTSPSDPSKP